ncbi:MAG: hypothetical protein ABW321_25255 [Polyangiales bacterium]
MVDVRSLVEQAVARAVEPLQQAASETAGVGAAAAQQGMQVTQAVAATLSATLKALPGKLRELELPSASQRLEEVSDQLAKIGDRMKRLSDHLGRASRHLGEPALQTSGQLIVDGFEAAASGARFLRPSEKGLIRLLPRSLSRPYIDGITTISVGLSAASDLTKLSVGSLPAIASGLGDIAEDLGSAGGLLVATAGTLRELSELSPI